MNDDFIIYSFALKGSFDFFFSDASFRKISLPSKDASYSLLLLCNSVVYDLYGSLPLSLERQMCRQQKLEIDAVRRAVRLMPTCMSTALLDHLTFVYEQKPSSSSQNKSSTQSVYLHNCAGQIENTFIFRKFLGQRESFRTSSGSSEAEHFFVFDTLVPYFSLHFFHFPKHAYRNNIEFSDGSEAFSFQVELCPVCQIELCNLVRIPIFQNYFYLILFMYM